LPKSTLFRRTRTLLLLAILVFGLIANAYLAVHLVCGDCLAPVAQINHIAHFLLIAAVPAILTARLLHSPRRLLIWLLPPILIFILWFGGNWLPKSTPTIQGTQITVATYNVQGNVSDPAQIIPTILDLDADIVALQELRGDLRTQNVHILSTKYPFYVTKEVTIGTGLGLTHPANFPITRIDHVWFSKEFTAIEATAITQSGTSDHLPLWARLDLR
jgi:endonuclease/exonuclease/phosphatase (EEP) superfamily protein YafD